jgi:polar amino acid transport system substrate-binding protein
MKRFTVFMTVLILVGTLCSGAWAGNTLKEVKKRGTLRVGVKDLTPGFGFVDMQTGEIRGYDVDFAQSIAKKLGVKLELWVVTDAERIGHLKDGKVDIIAATLTKTPERTKEIAFSHVYFVTGQKFLVRKGTVKGLYDLEHKIIGTSMGSTSIRNAKKALPTASILSYDGASQAFFALRQGEIFAVTTDEAILAGMLANAPDHMWYEIPDIRISDEPYALGVRKGDRAFLNVVNRTLLEMEKRGEAKKIFDKWFGPGSPTPMKRTFKITAKK